MRSIAYLFIIVAIASLFVGHKDKVDTGGNDMIITGTKIKYKNISATEAKKILDAQEGAILLDVRTKEEYEERHIPGSILIPLDVLGSNAEIKMPDKNATILVYCRSGRRSISASEILTRLGYQNVYNMGGIIAWPYEVE